MNNDYNASSVMSICPEYPCMNYLAGQKH